MSDPDRPIWDAVLAHLRASQPGLCRRWFDELEPLGVRGGSLVVRAHSPFHRDYLRRYCLDAFNDAIRTVTGRLIGARFIGPDERPDDAPAAPTARPTAKVGESLPINPDYGFDSFVVGPSNRLAHAAAVAVGANPGHAYNPLFIHGGVGLGKTHLLQAICLTIHENDPAASICYLSCEGFVTQFMEAVQGGRMTDFRHRFRDVDVLVIDDVHFLGAKDRTQEEFFHTFNSLYQANKQIVLSSDAPPEQIPDLEERLVSRFKWGLVAHVEPPDYETRVAILKTKAGIRGLELPDDAAYFIAERVDTNIRELEGAIVRLQIQSSVEGRPIDLGMTRSSLGAGRGPTRTTVQTIVDAVTNFYDVRLADLQSKRRARSVALPRQVCMYLARRHTQHSLGEIGGYFGGRDHTTVLHAVKIVGHRRDHDPEFERVVRTLESKILRPGG